MKLSEFKRENDMATFAAAMEYMKEHPGSTLEIEPGEYILTSDLAKNAQKNVMNGSYGVIPEKVMFNPDYKYTKGIDICGHKGTKIYAYGVTLMVDGFMEPVSVTDSEDVEIYGLTIDHKRKPYSRGRVVLAEKAGNNLKCVIELDKDCPIQKETPLRLRYKFFDKAHGYPLYSMLADVKYIDEYHLEQHIYDYEDIEPGDFFYTWHTFHSRPGILIERVKNMLLCDVTIHSQPGMGIVGNRSEDITMKRLSVVPSPGHHVSTNTDATHFTSTKGTLRYENCTFDGQGDDSSNVHGYFQEIIERISARECIMMEKTPGGTHAQTLDYPDIGDILELTDMDSLCVREKYTVLECEPMPEKWCTRIVLDKDIPEETNRLAFIDITRLPHLEIIGCNASKHIARGILIKTRSALIEGNTFADLPLAGIEAAAEGWWYEGVCPANVVIRRNRIINCGCGILIKADSEKADGQSIFNITVEDNIIDCPKAEYGIFARNVKGLKLARNKIIAGKEAIKITDCTDVVKE